MKVFLRFQKDSVYHVVCGVLCVIVLLRAVPGQVCAVRGHPILRQGGAFGLRSAQASGPVEDGEVVV